MKKKMLKFIGKDNKVYWVKERSPYRVWVYLSSYMTFPEKYYEYIPGTQEISINNGNIYAKFKDLRTGFVNTLCIADYEDYIHEIKFDFEK